MAAQARREAEDVKKEAALARKRAQKEAREVEAVAVRREQAAVAKAQRARREEAYLMGRIAAAEEGSPGVTL